MIEKVFIISCIVIGIWCMHLSGMILGRLTDWYENNLPECMKEPVYGCCVCMVFWYGTPLYWIIWGNSIMEWLVVIFASIGFNSIFVKLKNN